MTHEKKLSDILMDAYRAQIGKGLPPHERMREACADPEFVRRARAAMGKFSKVEQRCFISRTKLKFLRVSLNDSARPSRADTLYTEANDG